MAGSNSTSTYYFCNALSVKQGTFDSGEVDGSLVHREAEQRQSSELASVAFSIQKGEICFCKDRL